MREIIILFSVLIPFFVLSQKFDSLNVFTKNQQYVVKERKVIRPKMEKDTISKYLITRIDSVKSFYIIYAKNDIYRYKIKSAIHSFADGFKCIDKIKDGNIFQLDLRKYTEQNARIHIDDSFRGLPLEVNCDWISANDDKCREDLGYYNLTEEEKLIWDKKIILGGEDIHINREKYNLVCPDCYDLFNRALNLKGLCLVK